jgi:hypothetical protein
MAKGRDRIVYRRQEDHAWVNQRVDADRASSVHKTQSDAVRAAKENLGNQGGGELIIKSVKGPIRSKDTIPPGNDPNPPRDREH